MRSELKLTFVEIMLSALSGVMRRVEAIKSGRVNNHGLSNNLWEYDINGAIGEMAVAKWMGAYWAGTMGTFKRPDLPEGLQVRTTSRITGKLILRESDDPGDYYVLVVTGILPIVFIAGGISGSEAKVKENLGYLDPARPPCYQISQELLEPIDEMKKKAARKNGLK